MSAGFKFSRASYALSLLRPYIIEDLDLRKHGFKVYLRDPNSYTPLLEPQGSAKSLILSRSDDENRKQIGQFSKKDAEVLSFPICLSQWGSNMYISCVRTNILLYSAPSNVLTLSMILYFSCMVNTRTS